MAIALSVNLNKIALIRNSREGNYPNLVKHGQICLEAGAQGLTVHPRPDQRHIRASDLAPLKELLSHYPQAELNVEGNPFAGSKGSYPGLLELVEQHRPQQCTLVPDSDTQLTSDHGFDLRKDGPRLQPIIAQLREWGVRVSLFMDPDVEQIALAQEVGADRIELYTGPYAQAFDQPGDLWRALLEQHRVAAQAAQALGLGVNAGHDLNLANLTQFKTIEGLLEVSIGHALTVDALNMGLQKAVGAYLAICS